MEDKSASSALANDFDNFLASCSDADDVAQSQPLRVSGVVLRSKAAKSFVLQGADGSQVVLPRAAVTGFTAVAAGAAGRVVELSLDRTKLGEELAGKLAGSKLPYDKAPFVDTLKELTIEHATLKEIANIETIKEQAFDTLKEIGADGTGVGDTLAEGIYHGYGEELTYPAVRTRALATGLPVTAQAAPQPTLKPAALDTIKEVAWGEHTLKELTHDHTLKELTVDQTLKEVTHDPKYIKEVAKEMAKEVAWDPIPDWGSTVTNPVITQVAGAVAQQMLAAQALAGRLGY